MNAVDMGSFIAPKSDQLNADDLIAGPRTIKITGVRANEGSAEQPISISFDGDNGKPYKPCKSMRRVMVYVWGANASAYVGRSMTMYRDDDVQFGGMKVGGIRISHMSHIDAPQSMPLTTTRARRALFTVQPLQRAATANKPAAAATSTDDSSPCPTVAEYEACADEATHARLETRRRKHWEQTPNKRQLKAASDAALASIRAAAAQPEPLKLAGSPAEAEAQAIAVLEAAFSKGRDALAAEWPRVRDAYADRMEPIPLAVEAKYGELNEALKE